MLYALLAFLICFLLIVSALLLLFYREALGQRLAEVLSPRGAAAASIERSSGPDSLQTLAARLRRVLPQVGKESSVTRQRLILAGYREEWHMDLFSAARFLVPALFTALVVFSGLYASNPFIFLVAAIGIGYLAPDYWLGYRIKSRQSAIRSALPDVLDLIVICLEAGLSLDQAVMRTSDEMRSSAEMQSHHRILGEELNLVMHDVRGGRARSQAWKNLAERTDVETIRMVVSILVQADQFGTGISKTLRIHADQLRLRRRQRAEELAAKTTVKLVFPLVLFIFPSLFVVTIGPAVILLSEAFASGVK